MGTTFSSRTKLFCNHSPKVINNIPALPAVMYGRMTVTTNTLQVAPVQCDSRITDVVRCQFNLVVYYLTRFIQSLGKT